MASEQKGRVDETVPRTCRGAIVTFAGTCLLTLTSLIGGIIAIAIFASQSISSSVGISEALTLIAVWILGSPVFTSKSDNKSSHYYLFSISPSIFSQREETVITTRHDHRKNRQKQHVSLFFESQCWCGLQEQWLIWSQHWLCLPVLAAPHYVNYNKQLLWYRGLHGMCSYQADKFV
jgi:hypothetical protein